MLRESGEIARINGAELEYWDLGSGAPVLFIHGGMGDECSRVLLEPALTSRFRLIHFQRRGYGRSSFPESPVSIEQHAEDGLALLDSLGVGVAHIVGQSYGGAVSLQLTAQAPAVVRSLTVLEPALPSVIFSSPEFAAMGERANQLYQDGNGRAAIEQFGKAVNGEKGWDAFASDWLETWVGDAAVIFESDFPALGNWNFGSADANRISQPVLNLLGEDSPEVFRQVWDTVAEWIPQAENKIVTDSSHTILQMNPGGAAGCIVRHIERHPIAG